MLQNYETIAEVIETAENAEGSAAKENLKYVQSIEGRIEILNNKIQEFWHNLIGSNMVKNIVDIGTKLISVLDNIFSGLGDSGTMNFIIQFFSGLINLLDDLTNTLGKFNIAWAGLLGVFAFKKISGNNGGGRVKMFALMINNMPPNRLAERCASSGVH